MKELNVNGWDVKIKKEAIYRFCVYQFSIVNLHRLLHTILLITQKFLDKEVDVIKDVID